MSSFFTGKNGALREILFRYWLLVFYVVSIAYLELVYRLWSFRGIDSGFVFPIMFALTAGIVLFLISSIFPVEINMVLSILTTFLLVFCYGLQLVYYSIFQAPFSICSLEGTGDAMQFGDVIAGAVLKDIIAVVLLFVPFAVLFIMGSRLPFLRVKPLPVCAIFVICIASYAVSMVFVNMTGESAVSQRTLYYKTFSPELSVRKLGLMTTMRLDLERYAFGFQGEDAGLDSSGDEKDETVFIEDKGKDIPAVEGTVETIAATPVPQPTATKQVEYNTMDIDFKNLMSTEKNKTLLDMHKYFSAAKPTKKNEYTGMFKGYNLILVTAEGFSSYAVNQKYTPTLYKMSREGFVFNDFYNPIWGVSTSDGEYVACTGLIPKSGVWSFKQSGKNYLPFVMGRQFGELGYLTKAYHDHSYKYYNRDISHPNMGYDFKGTGNGLNIKKTWPESDLEMIEVTAGEYMNNQPFHTYYMTVSGHLQYNFTGNYIARKNKDLVAGLPYSDPSKAYIACNMELEFAMKALVEKLEAAGVADKTIIAISPDHYPYGLPRNCIDELAGHKVESNFELYKSTLIIWKKGMEPVVIDKPCSSLDIIPTLSNLFGLEYDSRLLMGKDILSDSPPLVIFSNRSWITDMAMYNSLTNTATFKDGAKSDAAYVKAINKVVADKFNFSTKILDTDYYRKIIVKAPKK